MNSFYLTFSRTIGIFLLGIFLISFSSCKGSKAAKAKLENQHEQVIYKRYKALMDATSLVEVTKILDYTHPKLFKIVPREQMEASIKDVFSSMKMITTELNVQNYSPIQEFEGEKYVLLDYTAKMKIINEDENMDIGTFAEIMGVSYGEENVKKIDDKSILIDVKGKSTFAVTSKDDGKWYFIENNNQSPLYNMLIPLEIQDKFGLNQN